MITALFATTAERDAANQAAVTLGIDPQAKLTTLSVPLVAKDGPDDAPATAWGARGSIPEGAELAAFTIWRWYTYHNGILIASHDGLHIGEPWGWVRSLDAENLKRQLIHP